MGVFDTPESPLVGMSFNDKRKISRTSNMRYSIASFKLEGLSSKLALTIRSLESSTCLHKTCDNLVTNVKIEDITINLDESNKDELISSLKKICLNKSENFKS